MERAVFLKIGFQIGFPRLNGLFIAEVSDNGAELTIQRAVAVTQAFDGTQVVAAVLCLMHGFDHIFVSDPFQYHLQRKFTAGFIEENCTSQRVVQHPEIAPDNDILRVAVIHFQHHWYGNHDFRITGIEIGILIEVFTDGVDIDAGPEVLVSGERLQILPEQQLPAPIPD